MFSIRSVSPASLGREHRNSDKGIYGDEYAKPMVWGRTFEVSSFGCYWPGGDRPEVGDRAGTTDQTSVCSPILRASSTSMTVVLPCGDLGGRCTVAPGEAARGCGGDSGSIRRTLVRP